MLAVMKNSVPSTSTASRIVARSRSATPRRIELSGVAGPQHDDELVTAETSEQRALPDGTADPLGHDGEQSVADAVPEAVVDRLEVVEVDEQQGHGTDRYLGEQGVHLGEQLGAVGQPGEVVVGGRPAQLVGDAALFGDVLDVRDRQRHAVVLGDGDTCAGPHEGAVAALVALVEQIRVDDSQLEPGAVDGRRLEVVRVRDLADAASDEVVDRSLQHLGERAVGIDDRRVVETHEGHARRGGVERLLESATGLLQGTTPALSLGEVDEPDDCSVGRAAGLVVGRLDDRDRSIGARQTQRRRIDTGTPAGFGEPGVEDRTVAGVDELA